MFGLNWENPEDYAHLKTYRNSMWAWEFLRRNKDYQADWDELHQLHTEGKDLFSQYKISCKRLNDILSNDALSLEKKLKIRLSHEVAEDVRIIELRQKIYENACLSPHGNKKEYDFFLWKEGVKEKWGCAVMHDPKNDDPIYFNSVNYPNFIAGKKHKIHEFGVFGYAPPDDGFAVIVNLNYPISPQMRAISSMLRGLQKKHKLLEMRTSRHKSKWIGYIRTYDAYIAGIKRSHAAPLLFGYKTGMTDNPERLWDETLKQVKKMVKSGYKELLYYW